MQQPHVDAGLRNMQRLRDSQFRESAYVSIRQHTSCETCSAENLSLSSLGLCSSSTVLEYTGAHPLDACIVAACVAAVFTACMLAFGSALT